MGLLFVFYPSVLDSSDLREFRLVCDVCQRVCDVSSKIGQFSRVCANGQGLVILN